MNSGKHETGRSPREVYADIIDLPHWDSPVHPRMTMHERAAQFAPYAALVGYGDMVKEEARETGLWTEPGEDEAGELDRALERIGALLAEGLIPACTITFFEADAKKDGGAFVTEEKRVRRIDTARRKLVFTERKGISGTYEEIGFDRITRIEGIIPEGG